jgi:4-amino-4-deoxy-L-arabinose transferase-like glycosyltransferase
MNSAVIPGRQSRQWLAPVVVFVAALLLYSINLNRPPHPDELHHVLAAQHLWETGRPVIGDGEYVRGILHTWMVALSYKIFGESLASARLPAVLFVALVAPLVFVWVRREAGELAAWLTAVLFLTSPFAVEIAQFSRFYALQIFSFTAGAMCTYYALGAGIAWWRCALLAAAAAGLFALATWLQVTTFMGLIGIAVWIVASLVWRFMILSSADTATRNRRFVAALVAAAALAVASMILLGEMHWAIDRYRYAPLFAARTVDEFWYYHVRFLLLYPTLWTLVGVFAIAAVLRNSRLGWLAITVFAISFLLASFAGQKEMRYFCFAQPFIAVVWGLGLAQLAPALTSWIRSSRQQLELGLSGGVLMSMVLALVVVMNPFWLRTATVIGNVALPGETPRTDWRAAQGVLSPWIEKSEIVITTEELGAIYFLGRSDVRYSPNKIQEIGPERRHEFGIDPRLGLPIIAKPGSLEKLMTCFDSGIVVGPIEHWGNPILIGKPEQAIIQAHARPIQVPRKSHLYAWGWSGQAAEQAAYCADLERFSGRRRAH